MICASWPPFSLYLLRSLQLLPTLGFPLACQSPGLLDPGRLHPGSQLIAVSRERLPTRGCQAQPLVGFHPVPSDTSAKIVEKAKGVLGAGVTLLGRESIPLDGFPPVTGAPPFPPCTSWPGQVDRQHYPARGPADPLAGLLRVPRHTATQVVEGTEPHLGRKRLLSRPRGEPIWQLLSRPAARRHPDRICWPIQLSAGISPRSPIPQTLDRIIAFRLSRWHPQPGRTRDQQSKEQQHPDSGRRRSPPHGHPSHPTRFHRESPS